MNLVKIVPRIGEDGKPQITQGWKVFLSDGSQLEGVTRIEILGETNSVWTARIDVICSMAEMDLILAQIALTAYDAPDAQKQVEITAMGDLESRQLYACAADLPDMQIDNCEIGGDEVTYRARTGVTVEELRTGEWDGGWAAQFRGEPSGLDHLPYSEDWKAQFRDRWTQHFRGEPFVPPVPDRRPGFFRFFSTGFCQFWEWLHGPKEAK